MNRLSFLKRLGALAVTAMIAEPLIEALAKAHTVTNPDKVMYYKVFHGGKEHTYWMWWSDYLRVQEFHTELENRAMNFRYNLPNPQLYESNDPTPN
jgi:hypothetical protein